MFRQAKFAVLYIPVSLLFVCIGVLLDQRTRIPDDHRRPKSFRRDAIACLSVGIVTGVASLTTIALIAPAWLYFRRYGEAYPDSEQQALAFGINGFIILAFSVVLDLRGDASRFFAKLLRWLVPIHVIGSIYFLDRVDAFGGSYGWTATLFIASCVLAALSIPKQWKPFLFSAMAGIALGYSRLITRLGSSTDPDEKLVIVTIGAALIGMIVVIFAWCLPGLAVMRRLAKWNRTRAESRRDRAVAVETGRV